MMKRYVRTVLAMLLALMLLCSCGTAPEDVGGNIQTLPPETTAPVQENPLSLGRIEGGTYRNEYVGYSCTLDNNWTFYSAQELQQLPDNVAQMMEGSELGEAMANIQQFTDMAAENVSDLTTMNVLYQKVSMAERITFATMSEEEIIDATLAQKDLMIDGYAQAGIIVEKMEKVTVTFLGESRTALHTTATVETVPYFILQIFDFHLGEYSVTTTLGSYVEDKTANLLALFVPAE